MNLLIRITIFLYLIGTPSVANRGRYIQFGVCQINPKERTMVAKKKSIRKPAKAKAVKKTKKPAAKKKAVKKVAKKAKKR